MLRLVDAPRHRPSPAAAVLHRRIAARRGDRGALADYVDQNPMPDFGTDKTAAIANRAIQSLGFKTNFTLVDQSVMYQKYCGDPKAAIDACPNVGWIRAAPGASSCPV